MNKIKRWVIATRLETTVLALASVGIGSALAAFAGSVKWYLSFWAALTASLLQTVCNLANDYGDFIHGADLINDLKPPSAIQVGWVTLKQVKHALYTLTLLAGCTGGLLLYLAALPALSLSFFILLGILAIAAALGYTAGKNPYGYQGWGDVAVFLFFGLLGIGGTFYLHTQQLCSIWLLPAISYGSLVVAVLNVNNIRDLATDGQAGKRTIPVRVGKKAALYYHWGLLAISIITVFVFLLVYADSPWPYICMCTTPLFIKHGIAIKQLGPEQLTKALQSLVSRILLFAFLLVAGLMLSVFVDKP